MQLIFLKRKNVVNIWEIASFCQLFLLNLPIGVLALPFHADRPLFSLLPALLSLFKAATNLNFQMCSSCYSV